MFADTLKVLMNEKNAKACDLVNDELLLFSEPSELYTKIRALYSI